MSAGTTASGQPWSRCRSCGMLVYAKRLARTLHVCPECGYHERLTATQRIDQLVDADTFELLPATAVSTDVLGFTDTRPYATRLRQARRDTGLDEAVVCGQGRVHDMPIVLAVMDFRFMGGSLGCAVGDLVTAAAEHALERRLPLLIVTASGGARMQEGCLSLMQMAKTSHAVARLRQAGLLTVSLVTDPTYGGVAASFGTNTDVVVAEAGARMGFAGPRVIQQTIRQELPEGFQTAEFLLRHGQLDSVEERRGIRDFLRRLLTAAHPASPRALPAPEPVLIDDRAKLDEPDAWDSVQLARNVDRPTFLDHLGRIFDAFVELHGDRLYGDCPAVVAGLARLDGLSVAVIGQQKGHTAAELAGRNFGMATPEGYRKALRVMRLAQQLGLPVVTLVDTPGAFPGVDAEERGQAAAIADSILAMSTLETPIVTVVTGEGGSGGALALAVADRVLMLENGTYSVISPEGCSAILWNTSAEAVEAARALRITAAELLGLGVVDGVVPEPPGGAHVDPAAAADLLRRAVLESLRELATSTPAELVRARYSRYRGYSGSGGLLDGAGEAA